ncbi:MAG: hypothetical protein LUG93_15820 [Lachnospiraceae bacterium]|nr:hypothetical protein [Lachnospiraceae bacterium]
MEGRNELEYTKINRTNFREKVLKLKSYYCREDFELALNDYNNAPKDSKIFRGNDLRKLCKARGMNMEDLCADPSILETIPTRAQMKEDLLQLFYDMYANSVDPAAYMERTVRRLAPEYNKDTVRTAILKKFLSGTDESFRRFHTGPFYGWAKERLSGEEKESLSSMSADGRKKLLISKIDDSVFEHAPIELTPVEVLLFIADQIGKYQADDRLDFTELELTEDTCALLDDFLKKNDLEQEGLTDSEKVKEIAFVIKNNLQSKTELKTEPAQTAELVNALERDFRSQLRQIKRLSKSASGKAEADAGTGVKAETKKNAKEETVDVRYKYAKRDALRAKKAAKKKNDLDADLLDMCSDLAAGNFRVNGKTKIYLYYFAFVFGMTVSVEGSDDDSDTDIETNLFQDFYNDNLLRFLSGDYADSKTASSVEKEPTGEGINYKNYVEAIYVYFLSHRELDMTPGQKIDMAESLIEECVKRAKTVSDKTEKRAATNTRFYRDQVISELLKKKINQIVDYVTSEFKIKDPANTGAARIMISSEESTAADLIEEIMEDLDSEVLDFDLYDSIQWAAQPKEVKEDMLFRINTEFEWKLKGFLEERFLYDADFMKVVAALDDRVRITNGRFNMMQRKRILLTLHILSQSTEEPVSMRRLQSGMQAKGIVSAGKQLSSAVSTLTDLGFAIKRPDPQKDNYILDVCNYEDERMNTLLRRVSYRYYEADDATEMMLDELLVGRLRFEKRVTRSELIAIHLNYYIVLLNEMESESPNTFPEVFEDYDSTISPILKEARYQPLSEKNIFDMYVVISLFFYLVENNGYM